MKDDPRLALLVESFQRFTGGPLVDPRLDPATALWEASLPVLAHGLGPDPVFFYGNRRALDLFEMDFAAFTALPSRLSAEPDAREARAALLARVARDGWIDDYAGVRVSATGRRFRIEATVVWNLVDAHGALHGQAAAIGRVVDLA